MRRVRPQKIFALDRPLAVVLGINEIASAVAVYLHRGGHAVILAHDPMPPVLRRGMAFHDALYGDRVRLDGIEALCIDFAADAYAVLAEPNRVAVTSLGLTDLLVLGGINAIIDARLQKRLLTPDFRGLARISVGLGPGFVTNENCDLAIGLRPSPAAADERVPDGTMPELAGTRFAGTSVGGRWWTAVDIGTRVFKGFVIGHVGGMPVPAPIDGVLRGIARDGLEVPAGAVLVEIDPHSRSCQWTGIDDGSRLIAKATVEAMKSHRLEKAALAPRSPSLLTH